MLGIGTHGPTQKSPFPSEFRRPSFLEGSKKEEKAKKKPSKIPNIFFVMKLGRNGKISAKSAEISGKSTV